MVMFAFFSGFSIGMISPFIEVLFEQPTEQQRAELRENVSVNSVTPGDLAQIKEYIKVQTQKYLLWSLWSEFVS
jgi:hypothetical protein